MSSQKSSFVPILICLQSFQKNKYGSHCNLNLVMFTNFSYFLLLPKKGSTSDASGGEKETMMMGYWQQHSPETPTSFILIDVTTNTHRGGVEDGDDNENSNGYADHWVQYYNASGGGRPRQQCRRLPQGTSWMHRPWWCCWCPVVGIGIGFVTVSIAIFAAVSSAIAFIWLFSVPPIIAVAAVVFAAVTAIVVAVNATAVAVTIVTTTPLLSLQWRSCCAALSSLCRAGWLLPVSSPLLLASSPRVPLFGQLLCIVKVAWQKMTMSIAKVAWQNSAAQQWWVMLWQCNRWQHRIS
jgi:hypothetical protein